MGLSSGLNSIVRLDVGGSLFSTTVGTLRRDPDSMLDRLASDVWHPSQAQVSVCVYVCVFVFVVPALPNLSGRSQAWLFVSPETYFLYLVIMFSVVHISVNR